MPPPVKIGPKHNVLDLSVRPPNLVTLGHEVKGQSGSHDVEVRFGNLAEASLLTLRSSGLSHYFSIFSH